MASSTQWVVQEIVGLRRERDLALRRLSQAQEVIDLLEADIASLKCWANLEYAGIVEKSRGQAAAPVDDGYDGTAWVHELWLCGLKENTILEEAEMIWTEEVPNPEGALVIADDLLSQGPLVKDALRCKLFIAAVLASTGALDEACKICSECLRECGQEPRFQDFIGLALYIRGRVCCAIGLHKKAHWDFSRAIFTPHYHEKIKKWQGLAESWYLELLQSKIDDHSDKNSETARWLQSTSHSRPKPDHSDEADNMTLKAKKPTESLKSNSSEDTLDSLDSLSGKALSTTDDCEYEHIESEIKAKEPTESSRETPSKWTFGSLDDALSKKALSNTDDSESTLGSLNALSENPVSTTDDGDSTLDSLDALSEKALITTDDRVSEHREKSEVKAKEPTESFKAKPSSWTFGSLDALPDLSTTDDREPTHRGKSEIKAKEPTESLEANSPKWTLGSLDGLSEKAASTTDDRESKHSEDSETTHQNSFLIEDILIGAGQRHQISFSSSIGSDIGYFKIRT